MPSSSPSGPTDTDIHLDSLPFLSTRNAHDEEHFADSPTIARHPHAPTSHDRNHGDGIEPESPVSARAPIIITPAWRLHLYNLLERPNSSPAAVLVHVLVTVLITFSALVTVLETVPAFHSLPGGLWFGLETSLVALFTVEYVARCVATSYSWSAFFGWVGCASLCFPFPFFLSLGSLTHPFSLLAFFGIMDLLAILPYYIEIALQKDTVSLPVFLPLDFPPP
jgi:potassium voltage-gated channel Shal-related subfamily D member 2